MIKGFVAVVGIGAMAVLSHGYGLAHLRAKGELDPLRREFIEVVDRTWPRVDPTCSEYCVLDYGGELDRVVNERNVWLKQHDCVALGQWLVHFPRLDSQWGTPETRRIFYWCPISMGT